MGYVGRDLYLDWAHWWRCEMMVDVEDLTLGCSTNETACETSVASVCRQRRPTIQGD
jgi:hypothetical protein